MLDIREIKSSVLRQFARGEPSKINPDWSDRLNRILFMLDAIVHPEELTGLGERFRPLPKRVGTYAVQITEGVYVTFKWSDEGHPVTVDLESLE